MWLTKTDNYDTICFVGLILTEHFVSVAQLDRATAF